MTRRRSERVLGRHDGPASAPRTTHQGDATPPRAHVPPPEPDPPDPNPSLSTARSDSSAALPSSGASTTTTGTPWSMVTAGSRHSTPASGTTTTPPESSLGAFATLADPASSPVTTANIPPPHQAGGVLDLDASAPPRPLDFEDFEFLLGEFTTLDNKYATDLASQNDRNSAFLAQLQSLSSAVSKQTTLASAMMSAITDLRTQMESTMKETVEAQQLSLAVRSENDAIRASLPDAAILARKVDDALVAINSLRTSILPTPPSATRVGTVPPAPSDTRGGNASTDELGTSGIDEAFAATDDAIHIGLQGLVSEVSNVLDRNINQLDGGQQHTTPPALVTLNSWQSGTVGRPRFHMIRTRLMPPEPRTTTHHSDDTSPSPGTRVDAGLSPSPQSGIGSPSPSPRHRDAALRGLDPLILSWHAGCVVGGDPIHDPRH